MCSSIRNLFNFLVGYRQRLSPCIGVAPRPRQPFVRKAARPRGELAAATPGGIWCLLVAAMTLAPASFAQGGRVSDFLTVKNWHGNLTITGTGSGSGSGGIYSDVWDYGVTSNVDFQLDTYDPRIQGWTGTFKGTSNVNAKDVATFSGCQQTFTQIFQGAVTGAGKTFTMLLQGTDQYAFYPSDYQAQGGTAMTVNSCVPGTEGGDTPVTWSPVLSDKIQTLPGSGFVLKGSQKVKMNSPEQPLSLIFGGTPATIDVTVEWDIEPGLQTDAEVVVQKTAEFQNWRPTAGSGGARGNSLNLIAKLQAKGGGTTNVTAAYFMWQLTKSSKEPGYAMNAPVSNPKSDFDLKLEGGPDFLPDDATAQSGKTRAGQLTQSTMTVASYDWGAFGKIKVTAVMPDQSQIVGYLEGDPSQTEVRLPMRSDSSLIADVWKKNHGVDGLSDVTDNESDPTGDGNPGDGLTLYEEYRGFIADGQHVEGNPKKKDYFIVNTAGAFYLSGVRLFQGLSGLEVHYTLKRGEMSGSRVVNFNHGEGAHNADQYGIIIVPFAANASYLEAVGGPATPKSITMVHAPKILPGADYSWINYLNSSLAHELFHACNVYHHGDAGYLKVTFYLDSATNTVRAGGVVKQVLEESGAPYPLPLNTAVTFYLGVAGDPHTGDDNCVMRYDDARGYISKADSSVVYLVDPEYAGYGLCTQSAGTGINDANREPQARYGDAVRGNCRGQLLVNDNVPAPKR